MAVDRGAVRLVVRRGAEAEDRVRQHRRDEREDDDADHDYEPEEEVDPVGLVRGRFRQPRQGKRNRRGDPAGDDSEPEQ